MMLVFATLCAILFEIFSLTKHLEFPIVIYILWSVGILFLSPPKQTKLYFVFMIACLFRIGFVWAEPILSDDLYRYMWEGKLLLEGGNPYTHPPSIFDIADPYLTKVNHPHISSVYPPIAMWCFAILSKISYTTVFFKCIFALFDLGNVWMLYQLLPLRLRTYIWIYVLHPLPIIESTHSGHLDVMGIFCVLVALRAHNIQKFNLGGFFLILGGGIKILPFSLLPWFGLGGLFGGGILLIFAGYPMWDLGAFDGLQTYLTHWSFNGSLYPIFYSIFPSFSRVILLLIWTGAIGYFFYQYQKRGDEEQYTMPRIVLYIFGIWFLCTPTAHPWYGLWIFPIAILCGSRFWTLLCALLPLSYHALLTIDPLTKNWDPSIWPQIIEYLIPCLLLLFPKISLLYFNPFLSSHLKTSKKYSSLSQI